MISRKTIKIAIASGKGGTGKTLLATNLAAAASRVRNTLLVDLDVEEPDDALFIGGTDGTVTDQYRMIPEWMEEKCTLCNICSEACRYHAVIRLGTFIAVFKELCHSCYACSELCPVQALPMRQHKIGDIRQSSEGQLTFIESRLEIGEEQAVPLIRQTHRLVDESFSDIPVQLFDCPPGTSCPVVASVKGAGFVILVTEPTPFGLHDLRLAAETMQKLEKPFGVVINRHGIGNDEVEIFCREQGIPVLARIPFDREIARLYSRGELVLDKISHVSDALDSIMDLTGITERSHV